VAYSGIGERRDEASPPLQREDEAVFFLALFGMMTVGFYFFAGIECFLFLWCGQEGRTKNCVRSYGVDGRIVDIHKGGRMNC